MRFTPAIERYGYSTDGHGGDKGNQPLGAISHGNSDGVTLLYLSFINKPVTGLVDGFIELANRPILTLVLQKQIGVVAATGGEKGAQAAFRIFECSERNSRYLYRFDFKRRRRRGQLRHGIEIRFREITHVGYIDCVSIDSKPTAGGGTASVLAP